MLQLSPTGSWVPIPGEVALRVLEKKKSAILLPIYLRNRTLAHILVLMQVVLVLICMQLAQLYVQSLQKLCLALHVPLVRLSLV